MIHRFFVQPCYHHLQGSGAATQAVREDRLNKNIVFWPCGLGQQILVAESY
jgi:hypothetical protein